MKIISLITLFLLVVVMAVTAQAVAQEKAAPIQEALPPSDLIAVLGAFPEEIRLLLAQVQDKHEEVFQRITFTTGTLRGARVVIALTGIGKVNAATTTLLTLEHYRPRVVLFTGIAGGVNPHMLPGDIVIGTRIAYHDYGTLAATGMERGPTRDPATHAENPLFFSSDTAWVARAKHVAENMVWEKVNTGNGFRTPAIRSGVIVTGDVFVASDAATKDLRQNMNADATEMEGAAVAQVCYQQRVPFVVIRSMSDNAGNNASHDVKTFYAVAAKNAAEFLMAIVGSSIGQK